MNKKMRNKPTYIVEIFFDKKIYSGAYYRKQWDTWGGGKEWPTFKEAKKQFNDLTVAGMWRFQYRIISSNGFVRLKSHK